MGVNGKKPQRQYKDYLSDFKDWDQKKHAKQWLVFPENIGPYLSIDETALSKGGALHYNNQQKRKRKKRSYSGHVFRGQGQGNYLGHGKLHEDHCWKMLPKSDTFHVQKPALEALQDIRIKHRWDAMDLENEQIKQARAENRTFSPKDFSNGDTRKQLLARSRYLLYKDPPNWTGNQYDRSKILLDKYPDIKIAFDLTQGLRNIFNTTKTMEVAYTKLAHWYKDVENTGFRAFNSIANTITQS